MYRKRSRSAKHSGGTSTTTQAVVTQKLGKESTYPRSNRIGWGTSWTLSFRPISKGLRSLTRRPWTTLRFSRGWVIESSGFSPEQKDTWHRRNTTRSPQSGGTCLTAPQCIHCCLSEENFHRRWKMHRLVLISKDKGNQSDPSACR